MSLKNKKLAKEMANSLVEGMRPIIEAVSADKKAQEEELLFKYFNIKAKKDKVRVRNVSIINDILGKKVEVEYFSDTEEFFTKKFNYNKVISEVEAKIDTDAKNVNNVFRRYHKFMLDFRNLIDSDRVREDYNLYKLCDYVINTFFKESESFTDLIEKKILMDEEIAIVEEFDKKLKDIAGRLGFKLEEESLEEASLRELLKHGVNSIGEMRFMMAASNYLKDKSENTDMSYKSFSKLERDEKVKIAYYETLHNKIEGFKFSLVRKNMQGEMLNKLIVESTQTAKRKEKTLMEMVLNGQGLEDSEYLDLAFMKINYRDLDVAELTKPYILEDIKERIAVLERLVELDSKREKVYSEKIEMLNNWRRLIHIFNCTDWNTDHDLYFFMDDIFKINVSDVEDYEATVRSGNPTNKSLDDQKFDYYEYLEIFEKIREFVEKHYEDEEALRLLLLTKLDRYEETLEKDHLLLNLSKKFREFEIYNGESIFDYKSVVEAYYDYFCEATIPVKGATTNIMLKKLVDEQVTKFEESISSEVRELIKDDKLSVPKKYFKKLEGK